MTIVLLLRECHGEHIKVKELDSMTKDCVYSGLHKQYQPLVIHLKDKAHTTASDLLRAIHVHEEAESNLEDRGYHYSPYWPKYDAAHKSRQDKYGKTAEGYATKVTQLPDEEQSEHAEPSEASDVDKNFEHGYYQGVIQAADMMEDLMLWRIGLSGPNRIDFPTCRKVDAVDPFGWSFIFFSSNEVRLSN